jgi:hypothetical protein
VAVAISRLMILPYRWFASGEIMGWFVKSPFKPDEDPVKHLVELLSKEAEKAGSPLTAVDKEILGRESSPLDPVPEDLQQKAKALITRVFEAEPVDEFERGSKSFSSSLLWVGDSHYPNIVALSDEVTRNIGGHSLFSSPLRGWKLLGDRAQLISCAVLAVLLIFAAVIGAGFLFGWK